MDTSFLKGLSLIMKARLIIFTVCGPVCEHLAKQLMMLRNTYFPD